MFGKTESEKSSQDIESSKTSSSLTSKLQSIGSTERGEPVKKGRPSNAELAEKEAIKEREKLIREMFSDEVITDLITMYPDVRFAMTGDDCFIMPDKDKIILTRLAKPCTAFIDTDPKWLALFLFTGVLIKVYGSMEAAHNTQEEVLKSPVKEEKKKDG